MEPTKTETKTETPTSSSAAPMARVPHEHDLATRPSFSMALEPTNLDQAWELAGYVAKSKLCGCQTQEEAISRILFGRNLGMSTMAAIANVHVIEGRPCIEATTMLGLCLQRDDICEYFECVASGPTAATWKAKRHGRPNEVVVTFTVEDAKRAGLVDRGEDERAKKMSNWNRYPEDMCNARAIARVARRLFPDLIRGFATTAEMNDERALKRAGYVEAEIVDEAPNGPTAGATGRDYGRELEEYKAKAAAADTRKDFDALRDTWKAAKDEGHPHLGAFEAAYNEAAKRKSDAKKKTEAPAADAKPEGEPK